jgi:uncharacterized repeat protein (TIGR01451 family)/fimbrial isopeptide formation D2 family protein
MIRRSLPSWLQWPEYAISRRARRRPLRTQRFARPFLEWLEGRTLLSGNPVPTAILTAPPTALIGADVPLSVSFANTGTPDTAVGYGPFVDVVMPVTGTAPPPPANGITFNPGSATYLGQPVTTTVLTFDANGNANHPYAVNPDGTPVVIHGPPGDQLVVFQLPFGSYTVGQPPAVINFTGHVSTQANINIPLPVTATGGFAFGTDPLDDPSTDPSIFGPTSTQDVTPTVLQLTKSYHGPESETVTGPNFPQTYTLSLKVANGQTLTNAAITDQLPANMQFVRVVSVSGNGATVITPSLPSTTMPGGTLTYHFNQIVGTGAVDAQVTFQFYIPQNDASGNPVIPLGSGGTATSVDHSGAQGTWLSPNPNVPPQTVATDPADPNTIHTLTDKTVAIQKSVTDLSGSSPKPGDTLQYTLNFQVSDFFALQNVIADDLMSDGQAFDTSFTPTITYIQHGATRGSSHRASGGFSPANYSATVQADGTTAVTFDVSSELSALGNPSGGDLLGAAIPVGGTGGPLPAPNPGGPPTTGTITFRATILSNYRVTPVPGAPLVQGDVLPDSVDVHGGVLHFADLTPTGNSVADNSSASVTLDHGTLTKAVYAVNGVVHPASNAVNPGDTVTFELQYTLPSSGVRDYQLTDFLPLPTLLVQPTTFNDVVSATPPAVGQAQFGPHDTFGALSGLVPAVTDDPNNNSLNFFFGTTAAGSGVASVSDILFTVRVSNQPFADALLQNNLVQAQEGSFTGPPSFSESAVAPIVVNQPAILDITKGVVSTNDPNGVFSGPVGPAGVTFAQPGLGPSQPSFTGLINSSGLDAQPIDATLSNVDAGNLVKFAIVIENTGHSTNGAFDVAFKDTLPAGFAIPAGGLNLQVDDGTGAPFTTIDLGGGLFGNGLELQDPGPTPIPPGALDPGQVGSTTVETGRNIAIVTYDLALTTAVTPLENIPNTATLTSYSSTPNGPNFVGPGGVNATTSVTIAAPTETKTLLGTSIENSVNSATQVVIGELATYQVHITIPQGTTPAAEIVDTMPAGLAFVGLDPAHPPVLDPGIAIGGSTTPTVANNGQLLTFNFGDVVNSNTNNVPRGITLTYQVVALNVATNVSGTTLTNAAQFFWTGHDLARVSAPAVTVIEPKLQTTKSVVVDGSGTVGEAGNSVVYTIRLQQAASSPTDAFNMTLSDPLPQLTGGASLLVAPTFTVADTAGLVSAANFSLTGSDATGYTLSTTGTGFDFPHNPTGRVITLTIHGTLAPQTPSGSSFRNTNTIQWTSLPGNPGQISPYNPNSTERTGAGGVNTYHTTSAATLLTTRQPTVAKQLLGTSIVSPSNGANQAVIGELANYEVILTIPHGVTVNAVLKDSLPAGLAFVRQTGFTNSDPGEVTFPGSTTPTVTNNGQTVTYNFGTITNTDTSPGKIDSLTFDYQVVVLNTTGNVAGTDLTNSAVLNYNTSSHTPTASAAPVTVIEPKLQVVKTASPSVAQAADVVTYTVVVSHANNSQTDAFDVAVSDLIPAGETFVPGSLRNTAGVAPDTIGFNAGTVSATYASFPLGSTSTLTYQATLDLSVTPGQLLNNGVVETWTSLPGNPGQISPYNGNSYERTGNPTDPGQLNNYRATAVAPVNVQVPSLVKTLVSTSIANSRDTNAQAVIGERVNYAVTVTIPQGTTPAADLIDQMPSGLAFVQMNSPAVVISDPAHVSFTGSGTPAVTNQGQTLDFALGTITNTDTNSSVAETITFNIQAVVCFVESLGPVGASEYVP